MATLAEIDERYHLLRAQRDKLEILSNQLAERMRKIRAELDAHIGSLRQNTMLQAQPHVRSAQAQRLRAEGSELVEQGKQIAAQQLQLVAQLNYLAQQRSELLA